MIRPTFRNWDLPQRRQIFSGLPLRKGRLDEPWRRPRSRPDVEVDVHLPPGGPLSGMAADVRDRPDEAVQGALAPLLLRRARLGAVRADHRRLPEYYPTRAERAILEEHSPAIVAAAGEPATLIELGSGSAAKTRVLLDAMRDAGCLRAYAPVDISEEITRDTAARIADEYGIAVHGLVCDFERDLERIPLGGRA